MPEATLLEFTIAHEVAHCVNQRYALKHSDDPVLATPLEAGQASENFADLYAIWLLSQEQLESRLYSEDLVLTKPSEKST
ncbi:hypothetical protein, partial [Vibrio cholerae]|uniref:hypothetical protein n=1 Tax=Vibrio cholerae TaxID=666 RepID=UPI00301CE11D